MSPLYPTKAVQKITRYSIVGRAKISREFSNNKGINELPQQMVGAICLRDLSVCWAADALIKASGWEMHEADSALCTTMVDV